MVQARRVVGPCQVGGKDTNTDKLKREQAFLGVRHRPGVKLFARKGGARGTLRSDSLFSPWMSSRALQGKPILKAGELKLEENESIAHVRKREFPR